MKDFYLNTRQTIDRYNEIVEKIKTCEQPTQDSEDEFLANFCIYLAHSLIKDTGYNDIAREELCKVADIINDVCR